MLDQLLEPLPGLGADERGHGHGPLQRALQRADEHGAELLGFELAAAHGAERVAGGRGAGEQQEVGGHQTARLVGVVAEQRADLDAMAHGQQRQHRLAAVLV